MDMLLAFAIFTFVVLEALYNGNFFGLISVMIVLYLMMVVPYVAFLCSSYLKMQAILIHVTVGLSKYGMERYRDSPARPDGLLISSLLQSVVFAVVWLLSWILKLSASTLVASGF